MEIWVDSPVRGLTIADARDTNAEADVMDSARMTASMVRE